MASIRRANGQLISDTDWSGTNESSAQSIADCASELWLDNGYKERAEQLAIRNKYLLFGDQWYVRSRKPDVWAVNTELPGWRARLTFNDILVSVEQRIAKYEREGRVWTAQLATDDLDDKIIQRTMSQVLEYYWTTVLDMPAVMREAAMWAMSSAAVFGHVYWDHMAGPMIETKMEDWLFGAQYFNDPAKQQAFIQQQQNRFFQLYGIEAFNQGKYVGRGGDVRVDVASIFEVGWWPRNVMRWEDVRIWTRTVKKTVEEVAERFEMSREEVRGLAMPRQHGWRGNGTPSSRWRDLYFHGDATGNIDGNDDTVLVHTLYRTPNKEYPNGRQAVVVGNSGHTVRMPDGQYAVDIQNPAHRVPIVPLVEKPIRGGVLGTCIVDQLQSAQDDINTAMSQAADYRNSRVAPTLVNFAANVNQGGALSTRPGKVFTATDPTTIPQAFKMPDVAIDYFRFADTDRLWMSRISGVASIDVGATDDANVRSGRALIALREQNDLRLIPFGKGLNKFCEPIGELTILLVQERVISERFGHLTGDDNRYETFAFKGADLQTTTYASGQYDKSLVRVTAFSVIPKSAQELGNFVSTALTPGPDGRTLLDPDLDRSEILDMLGMGHMRKAFDRRRLDTVGVHRLLKMWESGQTGPPPDRDADDAVYVTEIVKWKKTDGYRIAVGRNPMVMHDVERRLSSHKTNQVRKLIEPQYRLVRAHASLWMQTRAEMLEEIAPVGPDGSIDPAQKEIAEQLVTLLLPAPLIAIGMGAPTGAAGGEGESEKGGEPPNRGLGKRTKPKQDNSHMQGVHKADQQSAA